MVKMAMTQNFVRLVTDEVDNKKYLRYREKSDNNWTNDITDRFDYTIFQGYHGYTLAFRTETIYDLYRVYDEDGNLILETEDEVVELPSRFDIGKGIQVRAFSKINDKLVLKGINEKLIQIPSRKRGKSSYSLSVIVPLYNSELFMCRTIDSILSSSMTDIELILIDDGSTDNSYDIAKRYAENYGCVVAHHQENQGVSFARNLGLDLALGEYVAFCDNDDIIHPYMYEKLFQTCITEGVDIAICPALIRKDIEDKEWHLTCSARPEKTVLYSFEDMVQSRGTKGNIFRVAVWNKIVKTDVAKLAKFPTDYSGPGILYEDVAYTGMLYSYIDKFAHCKDAFYTRDKRKQKTVGTASTWHSKYDNEYVWKMFIYGFTYPLYNKSGKHLEAHDYTHFKRLIESYDKFDRPSPLKTYRDMELKKLVTSQNLSENGLIMADSHLEKVVRDHM